MDKRADVIVSVKVHCNSRYGTVRADRIHGGVTRVDGARPASAPFVHPLAVSALRPSTGITGPGQGPPATAAGRIPPSAMFIRLPKSGREFNRTENITGGILPVAPGKRRFSDGVNKNLN